MTASTRPTSVFNATSKVLTGPFVTEGPGDTPEVFAAKLAKLRAEYGTPYVAFANAIRAGKVDRAAVAAFTGDLAMLMRRVATIEGVVAFTADPYGVDLVCRLTHPMAVAYGYWKLDRPPLVDRLAALAAEFGWKNEAILHGEPSLAVDVYLRLREALAPSSIEGAIASSAPESEWASVVGPLSEGLRQHYGASPEGCAAVTAIAEMDEHRGPERFAMVAEFARSARQQRAAVRAVREAYTCWNYMWQYWAGEKSDVRLNMTSNRRLERTN